jgi:hypothetical protein
MLSHAQNIRPLRNQMPRHMQELTREIRVDKKVLAHSGSGQKIMAVIRKLS